jgi:hypothetical protein
LIGLLDFVDQRQNSIVPPTNEFSLEATEIV